MHPEYKLNIIVTFLIIAFVIIVTSIFRYDKRTELNDLLQPDPGITETFMIVGVSYITNIDDIVTYALVSIHTDKINTNKINKMRVLRLLSTTNFQTNQQYFWNVFADSEDGYIKVFLGTNYKNMKTNLVVKREYTNYLNVP